MGAGEKFGDEFKDLFNHVEEEAKRRKAERDQWEQEQRQRAQQPTPNQQKKQQETSAKERVQRLAQRAAQLLTENEVDSDFTIMNRTAEIKRTKVSGGLFPKYKKENIYEEGEQGWNISWYHKPVRWTGSGPDGDPATVSPVTYIDKNGKEKSAGYHGEVISMNLLANGELQYVATPDVPQGDVRSDEMAPVQKPMDEVDYQIAEKRLANFILQHQDKLQ